MGSYEYQSGQDGSGGRPSIREGDPTSHGGVVIEGMPGFSVFGKNIACLGFLVSCPKHGIQRIAEGEPSYEVFGRPVALAGMRTTCGAKLIPTQFHDMVVPTSLVGLGLATGFVRDEATDTWIELTDAQREEVSNKLAEGKPSPATDEKGSRLICPNMSNEEFCKMIESIKAKAIAKLEQRLVALDRWSDSDQQYAKIWFGTSDEVLRQYLRQGILQCLRVMKSLTCSNFIRHSPSWGKAVGCSPTPDVNPAAAVCAPDTKSRTIAIGQDFCEMEDEKVLYGTDIQLGGDTRLQTLVHEVTHFKDTFGAVDIVYGILNSGKFAKDPNSRKNADNLANYILAVQPNAVHS